MKNMKNVKNKIILCSALLFASAAVFAQGDMHKSMQDHEKMMKVWHEKLEHRQNKLHQKLQLDASQEVLWTAYNQAVLEKPAMPEHHMSKDKNAMQKTAPEKIDRALAMLNAHQAYMTKVAATMKDLYAKLNSHQQVIFNDNALPHFGGHHMHHMMKRHHGVQNDRANASLKANSSSSASSHAGH